MSQKTLGIIKPDAFKKRVVGKILTRIEEEGFTIVGMRLHRLTMDEAKAFYIVHKDRPFYDELVEFMASGPVRPAPPRARRRRPPLARGDGRHRPGQGQARHPAARVRLRHRAQRPARLGLGRDRRVGNGLFLQEIGYFPDRDSPARAPLDIPLPHGSRLAPRLG